MGDPVRLVIGGNTRSVLLRMLAIEHRHSAQFALLIVALQAASSVCAVGWAEPCEAQQFQNVLGFISFSPTYTGARR